MDVSEALEPDPGALGLQLWGTWVRWKRRSRKKMCLEGISEALRLTFPCGSSSGALAVQNCGKDFK